MRTTLRYLVLKPKKLLSGYNTLMTEPGSICRIDDLTIDFARRKVFDRNHEEILLPALSFDTLRALVEASPAVLTNDELIERREARKDREPTAEELFEMRAAFGEGATIVDVMTGRTIQL